MKTEPPYSSERVGIHLEIPTALRDALRESARKNERTFTAECQRAFRLYLNGKRERA